MQRYRFIIPMAVVLSAASLAASANDYRVYSAAGELPEQRMVRMAEAELASQREMLGRMPPPLPRSSGASAVPAPQSQTATYDRSQSSYQPGAAGPIPVERAQSQQYGGSTPSQPVINHSFDDVMAESVTVDVQDMRWEDIVTNIMPSGWRVRFQRVGDSILEQRADITITNASREEVLHALLSRAGLSLEPFPEFDVPLLIVSKQNGAQ